MVTWSESTVRELFFKRRFAYPNHIAVPSWLFLNTNTRWNSWIFDMHILKYSISVTYCDLTTILSRRRSRHAQWTLQIDLSKTLPKEYFAFYIGLSLTGIDIYFREILERIISRNRWPWFWRDLGRDSKEEGREELKVTSDVIRLKSARTMEYLKH
jgi:hypothetical protein